MPKAKKFTRGSEEHKAHMRSIGPKGGNESKKRMLAINPYHYQEIGKSGGEATKKLYGDDYKSKYSEMGKKSSKRWNEEEE